MHADGSHASPSDGGVPRRPPPESPHHRTGGGDDDQRGRAQRHAARPGARRHARRPARPQPARRLRAARAGRYDDRRGLPPRRRARPHAEVEALRAAGDAARGATAVVTLEPCNHTGRTVRAPRRSSPPAYAASCSRSPTPTRSPMGGADRLREAGIEVEGGLLADEARAVNRTWTFALEHGRPFVDVEVRHHPRRPQRRRRRHQPLGLQPRRAPRHPPPPRAVRHDARRHRTRSRSTTPSSPSATRSTSRSRTSRCAP